MTTTADSLWMTRAALERLERELVDLTDPARAGDAATDARVLQLRDMIRRAEVQAKPDDGLVEPGMQITVRFEKDGSEESFLLGSREVIGDSDLDVYSPTSPLGAAINGRSVGDTAQYTAPNGATIAVTVLAAVPFA